MIAITTSLSKLNDRYQTTIPSDVRNQLKLKKGDQIHYCTEINGRVYIEPVNPNDTDDPALDVFLSFIEADIKENPNHLQAFEGVLLERLTSLVGDVGINLDKPLSNSNE